MKPQTKTTTLQSNCIAFVILFLFTFAMSNQQAKAQCKAQFTVKYINDSTVEVTDTSVVNGPYKLVFNTGSGDTAMRKKFVYTYYASGYYTICLDVWDSAGTCHDRICKEIKIKTWGCQANYTFTNKGPQISFINKSVTNAGFTSHWDLGDGTTSQLENPAKVYTLPGIYTVCLKVKDTANNCEAEICQPVTVEFMATGSAKKRISDQVKLYPNPVNDRLNIQLPGNMNNAALIFTVYNMQGQKMLQLNYPAYSKTAELNTTAIDKGLYILQVQSADGFIYASTFSKQ